METAKAFGYRWGDWLKECPVLRAKMMAHELHKAQRESYYHERIARGGGRKTSESSDPLEAIKRRWGMKY